MRSFSRSRGRGSKYDGIIKAADDLKKGKAIMIEDLSYSEVTGLRNRIKAHLGDGYSVAAAKSDRENNLYTAMVSHDEDDF
jgi:hypothetical protein